MEDREKKEKKNIFQWILHILGFQKLSESEKAFQRDANIRSTIYMSAIIIVLETWMIIRYIKKY